MVNIVEKEGTVILYGEDFELKIDNNRQIYVKAKDSSQFNSVGELERGYSIDEKKKYLYNLYKKVIELKREKQSQEQQTI